MPGPTCAELEQEPTAGGPQCPQRASVDSGAPGERRATPRALALPCPTTPSSRRRLPGTAVVAAHLLARWPPGGRTPRPASLARQLAGAPRSGRPHDHPQPGGLALVGDALDPPFPDLTFGRILTGHFYGHLPPSERVTFLAEAQRVASELIVIDSALRPAVGPATVYATRSASATSPGSSWPTNSTAKYCWTEPGSPPHAPPGPGPLTRQSIPVGHRLLGQSLPGGEAALLVVEEHR